MFSTGAPEFCTNHPQVAQFHPHGFRKPTVHPALSYSLVCGRLHVVGETHQALNLAVSPFSVDQVPSQTHTMWCTRIFVSPKSGVVAHALVA
jgi:hypothetical protein